MDHRKFISIYALFFSFLMTIIARIVNAINIEQFIGGELDETTSMNLSDLFEDTIEAEISNSSNLFVSIGLTILIISIFIEAISLIPNSNYALIIKIKEVTAAYTDKLFTFTSLSSELMYLIGIFTLLAYRSEFNDLYAVDEVFMGIRIFQEAKLGSALFFLILATLGILASLFMSEKNVFISQKEKMKAN